LPKSDLERFKRTSLVRRSINQPSYYIWRAKSLKSFAEGGRVGPLDSGKGRKSNWHVPFFGFLSTDSLTKLNKETLRVCCLICPNLTTVQCVQSTMQRHLILKHEAISQALIQNSSTAKSEQFWRHILRQAK